FFRSHKMPLLSECKNEFEEMVCFKNAMEEVTSQPLWMKSHQIERQQWNPYSQEGGTTCAISGDNFVVVGADTRMTQYDINIISRDAEKIHILNNKIILATAGFYGDVLELNRVLEARLHKFRFDYRKDMTVDLCSELLARNLYYKRFFPFITGSVLAGIDEKGKGAVYSYDPIGCIERTPYTASGTGEPLIMPFLDCQVGHCTKSGDGERPQLTIERATALVKDVFRMVAEREIGTGDKINLVIAEAGKPIKHVFLPLRED
uniref:Proteasome subunit beta n=1 Tax=Strongyloides stercoralis TaxID=6248 RepID=A0AAF5D9I3_STRER